MGAHEGRGTLSKAAKELELRWQRARGDWRDEQAEKFEEEVLVPLERCVKQAGTAIDQMAAALGAAKRDCR